MIKTGSFYTRSVFLKCKAKLLEKNSSIFDFAPINIKIIDEKNSKSIKLLTMLGRESVDLTESKTVNIVMNLQEKVMSNIHNGAHNGSDSFSTYLKTREVIWYWVLITIEMLTIALIFLIPENIYPWNYVRSILGAVFVLFLPGFVCIRAFSKNNQHEKTSMQSLERIQQLAYSIGMSIALVSILGLFLYYSPLGLNLSAIVFSLLGFTSICATISIIVDYKSRKEEK